MKQTVRRQQLAILEAALRDRPDLCSRSSNYVATETGLGWAFVDANRWRFQKRPEVMLDAAGHKVGTKRRSRTPATARKRPPTKAELAAELAELRRETGRAISDKVAAYRMRENRSEWKRIGVDAIAALASLVPPELAFALQSDGYVTVVLDGEPIVIAPPDECLSMIVHAAAIAEDVEDECHSWEEKRPIRDADALVKERIVEAVRGGEL